MKKILLMLLMIIGCLSTAAAQGHGGKKQHDNMFAEIQEFKMKFLAQEMELKDDQKEQFFQLYDEMSRKKWECMAPAWKLERAVKKNAAATELDYQEAAAAMTKAKEECSAIDRQYDEKFATFLTQKQIFKMNSAEDEFRKKMQEMKQNKKRKR